MIPFLGMPNRFQLYNQKYICINSLKEKFYHKEYVVVKKETHDSEHISQYENIIICETFLQLTKYLIMQRVW